MDVSVRGIRPEDLFYIAELEEKTFGVDAFDFNYLFYLYENCRDYFLVAEFKGLLVGYIVSCLEGQELHVHSIAVAEELRGRGIGRRLMEETLHLARERGVKRVRLEVKCDNTPAIALYERLGFEKKVLLKNYYRDGSDAYLLILNLEEARQ